jgi:hypothetical protein
LIDWLDGLNIDVCDDEVVLRESEVGSDLSSLLGSKDGLSDDLGRVPVEGIEGNSCNGTTDT